jgi:hypothetical protein
LISAVLVQCVLILRQAGPDLLAIRGAMGQHGLWRSGNFFQNQRFADYVNFLNEFIAEDARVVLPPLDSGPRILGVTPYMQFFLAPREVINCPDQECLDKLSMANTYVVFTESEVADGLADSPDQVWMFDEGWGLVAPAGVSRQVLDPALGFASLGEILLAVLWPTLGLLLVSQAGALVVARLVPPRWHVSVKLALGYGLALGLISLVAATASLLGLPLGRETLLWVSLVFIVVALAFYFIDRRYGRSEIETEADRTPHKLRLDFWGMTFLVLGGLAFLISAGKGYHSTDAIVLWGAKGYGIMATGTSKEVTAWGTNTVPYPLNIPILIAGLKILFSDILPASKLVFSGYYLALLFTLYHGLLWLGLRRAMAGLATLLVGTAPLVFRHGTIGYANLVMSFYLVAALFLAGQALDSPAARRSNRLAFLGGVFFACAAWTRPEGLALSVLVLVLLFGVTYIRRRALFPTRQLVYATLSLLVYGAFWWLVKVWVYPSGVAKTGLGGAALREMLAGDINFYEAFYILRTFVVHLFRLYTWGSFGVGLVIVLLLSVVVIWRRRAFTDIVLWSGILIVLAILGIYFLASYDRVHDISWWVNTGLDRMLLPGLMLLWVGGISMVKLFYDDE